MFSVVPICSVVYPTFIFVLLKEAQNIAPGVNPGNSYPINNRSVYPRKTALRNLHVTCHGLSCLIIAKLQVLSVKMDMGRIV
jgi:hypothetical protein